MAKCRVVLTFPPDQVEKPVAYHLVKDFDLKINILRAKIDPNEAGKLLLEIENHSSATIRKGLDYLRDQGVVVELVGREVKLDSDRCVHCGACTAVCHSKALEMDTVTWKLRFDKERCSVCGLCANACPLKVISIDF